MTGLEKIEIKDIKICMLNFKAKLLDDAKLPAFKGSMLRGQIGHALKKITCFSDEKICSECRYSTGCFYFKMYEPVIDERGKTSQHSYLVQCQNNDTMSKKGDILDFTISLFGDLVQYNPYVIKSVFDLQKRGITKDRAPVRIIGIDALFPGSKKCVYDGDELSLESVEWNLGASIENIEMPATHDVSIEFMTPFRTKVNGKLARKFSADSFFRALLERMGALGVLSPDHVRELVASLNKRYKDLIFNVHRSYWKEYSRYSNRQATAMQLGGVIGSFNVGIPKDMPMMRLLGMGEYTGVGKATTFGLGRYRILKESI